MNPRDRRPTIIRATPEMSNWMHPQTDERKQQIEKRIAAAKERFSQRKKHELRSGNSFTSRVEIQGDSIPVVVLKAKPYSKFMSTPCKLVKLKTNKKLRLRAQIGRQTERKPGR